MELAVRNPRSSSTGERRESSRQSVTGSQSEIEGVTRLLLVNQLQVIDGTRDSKVRKDKTPKRRTVNRSYRENFWDSREETRHPSHICTS